MRDNGEPPRRRSGDFAPFESKRTDQRRLPPERMQQAASTRDSAAQNGSSPDNIVELDDFGRDIRPVKAESDHSRSKVNGAHDRPIDDAMGQAQLNGREDHKKPAAKEAAPPAADQSLDYDPFEETFDAIEDEDDALRYDESSEDEGEEEERNGGTAEKRSASDAVSDNTSDKSKRPRVEG